MTETKQFGMTREGTQNYMEKLLARSVPPKAITECVIQYEKDFKYDDWLQGFLNRYSEKYK